jgi:hypothetical protein
MRAGLSSKLPSLMFIIRLVLTLALDGAGKSLMQRLFCSGRSDGSGSNDY